MFEMWKSKAMFDVWNVCQLQNSLFYIFFLKTKATIIIIIIIIWNI